MKKALLLTGLLLVLVAPLAMANGANLAWGKECLGLVSGSNNVMPFACASNTVPTGWSMTASFVVDANIPDFTSFDTFVEGVSETGAIPDWWKLSAVGDCRFGTGTNVTFSGAPALDCPDGLQGTAGGGGGYGYLTPTQIQMEAVYGTAVLAGLPVTAGTETFAGTFGIKNTQTTGTGACAGCDVGMVWGVYKILIGSVSNPAGFPITEAAGTSGNQCLVWQHVFPGQPCNPPVPARNTTWGQVKSLYR